MTLQEYKNKKMKEPAFAKAYEEIQPELNVIRAMIDARTSQNLTQKQLAEKTGIAQTEISRLENGTGNPSVLFGWTNPPKQLPQQNASLNPAASQDKLPESVILENQEKQ